MCLIRVRAKLCRSGPDLRMAGVEPIGMGISGKNNNNRLVLVDYYSPYRLGVDRYGFFRADADTDYYRSSRPITDILNRYTCLV